MIISRGGEQEPESELWGPEVLEGAGAMRAGALGF